jgi:hypothetical protein
MFDSNILDVAIGLTFVYLLLSLLATTIGELIARASALRASTLYDAIRNLFANLDDPLLADFWEHPLIKTLSLRDRGMGPGQGKGKPSYIPANLFVLALLDSIHARSGVTDKLTTSADVQLAVGAIGDAELRRLLLAVIGVDSKSLEQTQKDLAKWFDEYMQRVSGWYKRKAQIIALILGLLLAAILNVDSLTIANTLIANPAMRASVAQIATDYVRTPTDTGSSEITATVPVTDTQYLAEKVNQIASLQGKLASLNLPILWMPNDTEIVDPREVPRLDDWSGWLYKIIGLLVTGLLVSLGAPFWFDLLNKFVNLRAAGERPEPVTDSETMSSGGATLPSSDIVKPTSPGPSPEPNYQAELDSLADEAVRYVEDLRTSGHLKLREDDVAISHVIIAAAARQMDIDETQIGPAVRAAFDRRRGG